MILFGYLRSNPDLKKRPRKKKEEKKRILNQKRLPDKTLTSRIKIIFSRSLGVVVANVLDRDIVASESEHQLGYYIHFRSKNLEKDMSLLILSTMG